MSDPTPSAPEEASVPTRVLRVSRSLVIPLEEFEWRFSGSGGPGGQHANTSNTRVECVFSIATSPSLGPRQREKLLGRFGPVLRVVAADERSQLRNRDLALRRMSERLAAALVEERRRISTKPTRASKERRLQTKRVRSATKQQRRRDPSAE
ncbi:MAG TPA: alternative ribosome rescue aminoacyl-tRNA hydrolase ArfB [Acidimicrobiales bacterium]